jgi:hypothetical protein
MNIFYLDKDPVIAAQMCCDKHVVKMIIESAQMLSTAHRILDGTQYLDKTANGRNIKRWRLQNKTNENIIYKASHVNHPSTVWVMQSAYNHTENHMTIRKLKTILHRPPMNISLSKLLTDPTPAMPDECKIPGDVVGSYRKYYVEKKQQLATWKSPGVMPDWFKEAISNEI